MRWMLKCSGPPIQGRSILATKMLTPRTSPAKSEPYNKYKRQGAHEHIVLSATPSNSLGEHPEKVLRRTGLARADWNEPAAVTALVRNVPRQTVVALARRLQETPGPQGPRRLARPNSVVVLFYWCLFSSDFSVQGC